MFEPTPNALFFLGLMGFSMLISATDLFASVRNARSRGFHRRKNFLAPKILVFADNAALVWYAFSWLPTVFASVLSVSVDEAFYVLFLVHVFWFFASSAMFFIRDVGSAEAPRSFIAHLFSRSDDRARQNLTSNQYAVMGSLGSAFGLPLCSEILGIRPSTHGGQMALIVALGLIFWVIFWLTKRLSKPYVI